MNVETHKMTNKVQDTDMTARQNGISKEEVRPILTEEGSSPFGTKNYDSTPGVLSGVLYGEADPAIKLSKEFC